jgi:hypothetical protein
MSSQSLTPHAPGWSLSKFMLVTALCAGYAGIVLALLYPIYMHIFVFD